MESLSFDKAVKSQKNDKKITNSNGMVYSIVSLKKNNKGELTKSETGQHYAPSRKSYLMNCIVSDKNKKSNNWKTI